ncbi:MAG TPA: HD domain-containing protein [Roseiflexaceae bacterium]|nr:HD domain-containing protein [Roseiflexaceae bacterium]
MDALDVDGAIRYALRRLEHELLPGYSYHSVVHTRDDVAPAAELLASMLQLSEEECLLLRTAAYYHDLGYVEQRAAHEAVAVQLAQLVLPRFGYSPAQIETIAGMIMATRLPQTPHTLAQQILADADLDILGRSDFLSRNRALRAELAAFGQHFDDAAWYGDQLRFLQSHRYWTAAARSLRDAYKQRNCEALEQLLARARQ